MDGRIAERYLIVMDGAMLAALDAAPGDVADAGRPADGYETARRWAAAAGLAPGRYAGPGARGCAALIARWAAARGWPAATAREAGDALRALGYRTVRPRRGGAAQRRVGLASPRQAHALSAAADAALAREGADAPG